MTSVYIIDTSIFIDEDKFLEAYETLSAERKKCVDKCGQISAKRLSLGAGVVLEYGLRMLTMYYGEFDYGYGRKGKPYIIGYEDIFFNISHSGKYAICAFSDMELGADIEKIRDVKEGVIQTVATQNEKDRLSNMSVEEKKSEFFRMWTIKESYMKALGVGFELAPNKIETRTIDCINASSEGYDSHFFFKEYSIEDYKVCVCSKEKEFAQNLCFVDIEKFIKKEGN